GAAASPAGPGDSRRGRERPDGSGKLPARPGSSRRLRERSARRPEVPGAAGKFPAAFSSSLVTARSSLEPPGSHQGPISVAAEEVLRLSQDRIREKLAILRA